MLIGRWCSNSPLVPRNDTVNHQCNQLERMGDLTSAHFPTWSSNTSRTLIGKNKNPKSYPRGYNSKNTNLYQKWHVVEKTTKYWNWVFRRETSKLMQVSVFSSSPRQSVHIHPHLSIHIHAERKTSVPLLTTVFLLCIKSIILQSYRQIRQIGTLQDQSQARPEPLFWGLVRSQVLRLRGPYV